MAKKNIATLIMAAGSSSRMGTPKQLLKWNDITLIEASIAMTLQLHDSKPIVVLGANSEKIIPKIEPYPIEIIHNLNWSRGLGNSIAFGVNHIQHNYKVDGVLIVLADQPLINASYLEEIRKSFKSNKGQIIATQYQRGKLGVPALFDMCYFQELSTIDGDKGAKEILNLYIEKIKTLAFKVNTLDIDTVKDYKELSKKHI